MHLVNLLHKGESVWTLLCTAHMLYFQSTTENHVKSSPLMLVCGKERGEVVLLEDSEVCQQCSEPCCLQLHCRIEYKRRPSSCLK